MRREASAIMAITATNASGAADVTDPVDLGPATALSCRECGTRFPLGPSFACLECFGPLEIAYDFGSVEAAELRKRIEAGPASIWRYAPLLPVPADVAS